MPAGKPVRKSSHPKVNSIQNNDLKISTIKEMDETNISVSHLTDSAISPLKNPFESPFIAPERKSKYQPVVKITDYRYEMQDPGIHHTVSLRKDLESSKKVPRVLKKA
jgi:hypothetical protein